MGILIWDDNFARNLNVCTERGVEIAWKKKKSCVFKSLPTISMLSLFCDIMS